MRGEWDGPMEIEVDDAVLAEGFVQVPVILLRLGNLGLGAKLMASAILWFSYRLGYWPGRKAAAIEFGIGERSVSRYLRELEDANIIVLRRAPDGKIVGIQVLPPGVWGKRVPDWHPHPKEPDRVPDSTSGVPIWHPTNIEDTNTRRVRVWKTLARALLDKGREPEQVTTVLTQYGASPEEAAEIVAGLIG